MSILDKILPPRREGAKKILLVDDEPHLQEIMESLLSGVKCEILLAGDGKEGVEMARKHLPAMIVMDMNMPVLSGVDATRLIRNDPRTRRIPILMCTSMSMMADAEKCFGAGATDYITKPLDPDQFKSKVAKILDKAP